MAVMRSLARGSVVGLLCLGMAGSAAAQVNVGAPTAGNRPHVQLRDPRVDLVRAATSIGRPRTVSELRRQHLRMAESRAALSRLADGGSGVGVVAAPPPMTAFVADGHGGDDVATVSWPTNAGSTVTVRSGRSGRLRWSHKLPAVFGFDVARLGVSHTPSLVLYETTFTGTGTTDPSGSADVGQQATSVVALSLSTGKAVWSSPPVAGTYAVTPVGFSEANAVYPGGILHDRHGDRVLTMRVTDSYDLAGASTELQPVVLDGTTGAQAATGTPTSGDDFGWVQPIGDVNGDGAVDWVTFVGGDVASVTVDSGSDGSRLWTQPLPQGGFVYAMSVPDLNGDGRPDLLVQSSGSTSGIVTAYAGPTGASLWSRSADGVIPLGRLTHGEAVALIAFDFAGFKITAVAGRGVTQWQSVIRPPELTGSGGVGIEFGAPGDVDGDHITDLYANISITSGSESANFTDILTGRTGHVSTGRALGEPLYGSLDGHGDDFLAVASLRGWSATASDGLSRRKLWTIPSARSKQKLVGTPVGIGRLGATRHHGLLMLFADKGVTTLRALDARTGHQVWSVPA